MNLNCPTPTPPYANWSTAATNIQDAVDAASTGDLIMVTNGVYETGVRTADESTRVVVDKTLILDSVNGPALTIINGLSIVRCIYLTPGAILDGFTLTNGVAALGGGVYCESSQAIILNCVLAGNRGTYGGGAAYSGTLANCMFTSNSAGYGGAAYGSTLANCEVLSNSADLGGGAANCTVLSCVLTNNTAFIGGGSYEGNLNGCTLAGNYAGGQGGGASSGTLSACTLIGNSTRSSGGGADSCALVGCVLTNNSSNLVGGGAWNCTMTNCVLTGNVAGDYGGGAEFCTLVNCTVVNNVASDTGGVDGGAVMNSIVYYNTGGYAPNISQATESCCCTTPQFSVPDGGENVNREPGFVDGSLHLQSNSPCINAGNNAYLTLSTDLDGNPRIKGGTVDIGAYEFQNPASVISYAWLQQYGLPTDGSADYADTDKDGMNNWQEWIAGTDPTNALSILKLLAPAQNNNLSGRTLTWQSVSGKIYFLQRSTNLVLHPVFRSIQSNITGLTGTTSFTDTSASSAGPYFYRVGLQ